MARGSRVAARLSGSLVALVAARTFPVYAALICIYVFFRLGSFTNIPGRVTDTQGYEAIAALPLWNWRFYAGERGFTIPLFFKLFHGAESRVVAQLVLSTLAWLVLAAAVAHAVRSPFVRPVAFAVVLVFSLSTEIILWDTLELSESVTFALTALLVAAWLPVARRPTRRRVISVLVLSLFWAFARDTNAYVLLAIAVLAGLTLVDSRARRAKLALALGCAAIGLLAIGSSDAGKRWLQPMRDVVARRVIPRPALRSYFAARGLDLNTNWPVSPWMNNSARSVYEGYLLRHPGYLLTAPLSGRQAALYSTAGNASSVLDPSTRLYDDNASHRFLPLPRAFEEAAFPRGITLLCCLLAVIVAAAALLTALGWGAPTWVVPAAILVTTYPHILVVWHLSGLEVDRHALEAALLLRLALLVLAVFCLDALVVSGFPLRHPRSPVRRGASSSKAPARSPS